MQSLKRVLLFGSVTALAYTLLAFAMYVNWEQRTDYHPNDIFKEHPQVVSERPRFWMGPLTMLIGEPPSKRWDPNGVWGTDEFKISIQDGRFKIVENLIGYTTPKSGNIVTQDLVGLEEDEIWIGRDGSEDRIQVFTGDESAKLILPRASDMINMAPTGSEQAQALNP